MRRGLGAPGGWERGQQAAGGDAGPGRAERGRGDAGTGAGRRRGDGGPRRACGLTWRGRGGWDPWRRRGGDPGPPCGCRALLPPGPWPALLPAAGPTAAFAAATLDAVQAGPAGPATGERVGSRLLPPGVTLDLGPRASVFSGARPGRGSVLQKLQQREPSVASLRGFLRESRCCAVSAKSPGPEAAAASSISIPRRARAAGPPPPPAPAPP